MTALLDSLQQQFKERLMLEFGKIPETGPGSKARGKFWDQFLQLGLPTKKMEVYQYVKLRKLYSQEFRAGTVSCSSEAKEIAEMRTFGPRLPVLVFCNGSFSPELSSMDSLPPNVVAIPLDQAVRTYGAFLNNHLARSLKQETDPFALLNGAMHSGGLFLYIPPNAALPHPIEVINLIDPKQCTAWFSPRIQVFGGGGSEFEIAVSNRTVSGEVFFSNQLIDFVLEDGARATLTQITMGASKSAWIFDAVRAFLKRDSHFRSVAVTNGAGTVRNDYKVHLSQENGEVSLSGLWMLKDAREAHTNVMIEHAAPNTRSEQLFKGVLNGESSSSFEGKILVRQAAQKTDAFQLNNNLLLSEKAYAGSKPNLEIFADDVKASHGATVGQLNEEHLFYLRARGFSTDAAKNILVEGFCREVSEKIRHAAIKEEIKTRIWDSLF